MGPEGGAGSSRECLVPRGPWRTHAAPLPWALAGLAQLPLGKGWKWAAGLGREIMAVGLRLWEGSSQSFFIVILGTMTSSPAAPGALQNPLTRMALALHSRAAASRGKGCQASV